MDKKVYVGYDTREDIAWQVCQHSLKLHSPTILVEPLKLSSLREHGWYWREKDLLGSTEFTFSRFLLPELMNFQGWALFCDSDIIFLDDVNKLFDQADDKYAVMCAKHDYTPKPESKWTAKFKQFTLERTGQVLCCLIVPIQVIKH